MACGWSVGSDGSPTVSCLESVLIQYDVTGQSPERRTDSHRRTVCVGQSKVKLSRCSLPVRRSGQFLEVFRKGWSDPDEGEDTHRRLSPRHPSQTSAQSANIRTPVDMSFAQERVERGISQFGRVDIGTLIMWITVQKITEMFRGRSSEPHRSLFFEEDQSGFWRSVD